MNEPVIAFDVGRMLFGDEPPLFLPAYLETNGWLTVFKAATGSAKPGLSIDPPWDVTQPKQVSAGDKAGARGQFACSRCAAIVDIDNADARLPKCASCGGEAWHRASSSSLR